MTRRAYWDRRGWLWEEQDDPSRMLLLWEPGSDFAAAPLQLTVPRRALERGAGPLVGVA